MAMAAFAAAHGRDAAAASANQTIQGVYAWTSVDGSSLDLVMTVDANAQATDAFATDTAYVFHTNSSATGGANFPGPTTGGVDVICVFNATAPATQCWAGTHYVAGDASSTAGLVSADGTVKVFAGLRNDPFFWNAAGFTKFDGDYVAAEGTLTPDAAGCPAVANAQSAFLISDLSGNGSSGAGTDAYTGQDVLAVVVEVKKSVLAVNGPQVAVWGATHVRVP